MPRITTYNRDTHRLEWVDATQEEYEAWKAKRADARTRTTPRGKTKSKTVVDSEPLESGSPPEPATGPKRKGGPNTRPESVLAPALPRLAQALAQLVHNASHTLTRDRAPLTPQESAYIAIPAVRIMDRTAAKYVKSTGAITPNQEDAAIIVVTVAMWLLGWLIAVLTNKPRGAPQVANVSNIPQSAVNDMFSGSEPVSRESGAPVTPSAAPEAVVDEGDLFAGSEPLAADGSAPAMVARQTDPRRGAVSDAVWQAITPTDRGEALAG